MKKDESTLTRADIEAIQQREWSATYAYCFNQSPFYQGHLASAGLSANTLLPLADIEAIPMIDKTCISERTGEFLCVSDNQVIDIVTTSGSTGKPLVAKLTEADLQRLGYNEYLSFRCVDLSSADRVVLAVTLDRCFIAGMAYFLGLRSLGASVIRIGASLPAMHLDALQNLRPTAIVGVPSFLSLLANKADEAGVDIATASVEKLICIGEPIRNPDMSLNTIGEDIEQRWNAKAFSTYGNTEIASSLCECHAGQGNHVHPELLYLETVDEQGHRVPDGEEGELVVTTFRMEAMPLIRYRTGDYTRLINETCACGRVTQRITPVTKRKNHKLKVKGTTIFPATLQTVLDRDPHVASYVILARQAPDLSDALEVLVCWTSDAARDARERLKEELRGEAKVSPEIREAPAAEIDALQMPSESRKRRFFVDLR